MRYSDRQAPSGMRQNGEGHERAVGGVMNGPDKAGEPSMEEILASIRQIVADEPDADGSSVVAPNPLVPRAASTDARRGPLLDRLSGVLKTGPLPPTNPLGSKRPLPFDQDLADMLDEPGVPISTSALAPKPDTRVVPELPFPSAKFADKTEAASKAVLDGSAALPPLLEVPPPQLPPLPFGGIDAGLAPPPRNTGFPPLRKKGFIPQMPPLPVYQPVEPVLDAAPGEPVLGISPDLGPAEAGQSSPQGHSDFGTFVSNVGTSRPAAPEWTPEWTVAASASSSPDLAGFPQDDVGVAGARARSFEASAFEAPSFEVPPSRLGSTPIDVAHAEVRLQTVPHANGASVPFAGAATRRADGGDQAAKAAQAFDALAQGLAASAAASTAPAALRLADPFESPVRGFSNGQAVALSPSQAPVAPSRTLEDAVSDMLRPMLQQWVADNMPRIMEKALRVELARSLKPGSKHSGS